jgi:HD-like signal output (HDOD) protein
MGVAEGVSAVQTGFRTKLVEVLKSHNEILPPAHSSLGRLWALIGSDLSSIDDCVEIIKLDPALTTRIFRLANSAAYNARAASVSEAILKIGFGQTRQVVFNAGVFEHFSKVALPAEMSHFWARNILTARLAERIATAYGAATGREYLAGLLHDVGWLLLATSFPEELDLVANSSSPSAEKETLSFTHAEISGAVCARSLLPPVVVNAVVHHHSPLFLDDDRGARLENPAFLGVILCLGDKIADLCGLTIPWQKDKKPSNTEAIRGSAEAQWLAQFGDRISYDALIAQELPKAKEIAAVFFK